MCATGLVHRHRFHSSTARDWDSEHQEDLLQTHNLPAITALSPSRQSNLTSPFPHLTLGFEELDINVDRESNLVKSLGIKATTNLSTNSFTSNVGIWGTGVLSSFGCMVLLSSSEVPNGPQDPRRFATGTETIDSTCDWADGDPQICSCPLETHSDPNGDCVQDKQFEQRIVFPFKFNHKPDVVVWISGFQMDQEGDWYDFGGEPVSITEAGFTLRFLRGPDDNVRSLQLSWVAFVPNDGLQSGVNQFQPQHAHGDPTHRLETVYCEKIAGIHAPRITQAFTRLRVHTAKVADHDDEHDSEGFRISLMKTNDGQCAGRVDVRWADDRWKWESKLSTWWYTELGTVVVSWVAHV